MNFYVYLIRMQKTILLFLLLLGVCQPGLSQSPSTIHYLDPSSDTLSLRGVEALPDSGAVLVYLNTITSASDSLCLVLTRVNKEGIPQVTRAVWKNLPADFLSIRSTQLAASGELLIRGREGTSSRTKNWLLFVDPTNLNVTNLIRLRSDSSLLQIFKVKETLNGDFLIMGNVRDTTTSSVSLYPGIMRMNRQGTVLWQKTFRDNPQYFGVIMAAKEYAPDRFLAFGLVEGLGSIIERYNVLWKMDGQGNISLIRRLNFDGVAVSSEIFEARNGNLLILASCGLGTGYGHSRNDLKNTVMIEVDTSANIQRILQYDDFLGINPFQQSDSTYAMLVQLHEPLDSARFGLVRLHEQGNILSSVYHKPPGISPNMYQLYETHLRMDPAGRLHYIQSCFDTLNQTYYNLYNIADGTGAAACDVTDTTLAAAVTLTSTTSFPNLPDTTYTVSTDSFPIFTAPYLNPVPALACEATCVWPGDANNDGIANLTDLLNLGIAFSNSGPARFGTGNQWLCYASQDWSQTFVNGLPHQHADCNGDGTVNADDTLAIQLNYGLTHQKNNGPLGPNSVDPELVLFIPQDTAYVGDTIRASLLLGTMGLSVDSIYGISFRVLYDKALVDSASARISYLNSWIGTPAQTLSLYRDQYSSGFIDGAIVRRDGNNVSGYGKIATVSFVLIDNIEGKQAGSEILPLEIGNYTAITYGENPLTFSVINDSLLVLDTTTVGKPPLNEASVNVFPNPSNARFRVDLQGINSSGYSLTNPMGRTLMQVKSQENSIILNLKRLPAGLYILSIKTSKGLLRKKLIKQ